MRKFSEIKWCHPPAPPRLLFWRHLKVIIIIVYTPKFGTQEYIKYTCGGFLPKMEPLKGHPGPSSTVVGLRA